MSIYKTSDKSLSLSLSLSFSALVLAIRLSSRLRHTLTLSLYLSLSFCFCRSPPGVSVKKKRRRKERKRTRARLRAYGTETNHANRETRALQIRACKGHQELTLITAILFILPLCFLALEQRRAFDTRRILLPLPTFLTSSSIN